MINPERDMTRLHRVLHNRDQVLTQLAQVDLILGLSLSGKIQSSKFVHAIIQLRNANIESGIRN
jgi:hypothetical protein